MHTLWMYVKVKAQGKSRMKVLCEALFPNRILMIEVFGKVDQKEVIMSSGIFGIDKGESIYWTGASFMKYQKYCPNELMVWEAMCILHERGAGDLNFGGMAHYKLKFGTEYAYVPSFVLTKYKWLHPFLHLMKKMIDKVHFSLGDIVKNMKNKIKKKRFVQFPKMVFSQETLSDILEIECICMKYFCGFQRY